MRRVASILIAAGMIMAAMGGPAAANYPDGYSPIIPWHQDSVDVAAGQTYEFGTRWGSCTPGLAQMAARHFEVVVTVDGEPVGPAGWSRPVNPDHAISLFSFADNCAANSFRGTGWWVFWNQPVTFQTPGTHSVGVTMTATNPVDDGAGTRLTAGWSISGTITVNVHES